MYLPKNINSGNPQEKDPPIFGYLDSLVDCKSTSEYEPACPESGLKEACRG
jgi:hypothetical protein